MDIFFSYSWEHDSEEVKAVYERLNAKGYNCWLDSQKIVKDETLWAEEIRIVLRSCKLVLLFYSDHLHDERLWGAIHMEHKWIEEIQNERNGLLLILPIGLYTNRSPPGQFNGPEPIFWKSESDLQKVVDAASKAIEEGKIEHSYPTPISFSFKEKNILSMLWSRMRASVVAGANRWISPLSGVQLNGINLGLLGTKKTDFVKIYVGYPTNKQIQHDVEKEYPFAFSSELNRVSFVCNKIIDLVDLNNLIVQRSDALNFLTRVCGNASGWNTEAYKNVLAMLAREVLICLRSNQSREVILSPENSNHIQPDCVLGVKIATNAQLGSGVLIYELAQIREYVNSTQLNCNSAHKEAAALIVLSARGEDVCDLNVCCLTHFDEPKWDVSVNVNLSVETSSTSAAKSSAIDADSEVRMQEALAFKQLLKGRWNESMNLLKSQQYEKIIDLWSPLDNDSYFRINHVEWADKPYFRCQIHMAKAHLFMSHVQLGSHGNSEAHMPCAFGLLEEVLTANPYSMKGSAPDRLEAEHAEIHNLNYKDILNFAIEWFNGWGGGVLVIYDISKSESDRLEKRVYERLHEIDLLFKIRNPS